MEAPISVFISMGWKDCIISGIKTIAFHRLKKIFPGLIFIICFFTPSSVPALNYSLPLPSDAVKISEIFLESGLQTSLVSRYESSWDRKKISSFYKKELKKSGWTDEGNDVFKKDNNTVVLQIRSKKNGKGKTRFFVIFREVPKKEEVFLRSIPAYPGSKQLSVSESARGVTGTYEAAGGIRDAVFFYKTRMPSYGWRLNGERFIKNGAVLVFSRPAKGLNEGCVINIGTTPMGKNKIISSGKFPISVRYYDYKERYDYKKFKIKH